MSWFVRPSLGRALVALCAVATFAGVRPCAAQTSVSDAPSVRDGTQAPLRTAAAVRALSPEEAARSQAVRLDGILLAVMSPALACVLMDDTEAVYVKTDLPEIASLKPGDWIELEGVTGPGDFAPMVFGRSFRKIAERPLPEPMQVSLSEVASGGFDAHWVEVEGIVRSSRSVPVLPQIATSEPVLTTVLNLAWGTERIPVRISSALAPEALVDARVRVRGVCFNVHNANRQFVSASLLAPGSSFVTVLVPPPPNPFALPVSRASELLQFRQAGFSGHRVHVRGTVLRHHSGNVLWLRDGVRGLRVVSAQAGEMAPGDQVDAAGFVDPGSYSPSLVDAVFRRTSGGEAPAPIEISTFDQAVKHDADLVRIEAVLATVNQAPEGIQLGLEWDGRIVQAVVPRPGPQSAAPSWDVGSRLALTGICSLAPEGFEPVTGLWVARSVRLLLRDSKDVAVLQPAHWLTTRRVLQLLAFSVGVLAAGVIVLWVVSRRRLAEREEERRMAEAEFAAMLRERNRMARDIHDTLAQGLNAVSMHLELAKNAAPVEPEGLLRHLATAHAIVRSCIAEARESIWSMRSQALERTDLPGALEGVARQLSEGLPLEIRVETAGPGRRLAPTIENDLLRIGQEAISNAVKHARARRLVVRLEFEEDRVRLRVSDDGSGFDVARAGRSSSRFGLVGMRERAERMHAALDVRSEPGRGTEVVVEVRQAM